MRGGNGADSSLAQLAAIRAVGNSAAGAQEPPPAAFAHFSPSQVRRALELGRAGRYDPPPPAFGKTFSPW